MKLIAAAFAGMLTLFTPTGLSQAQAEKITDYLDADVQLSVRVSESDPHDINGGFAPPGIYCGPLMCFEVAEPAILLVAGTEVPREYLTFVLLHEIGHYKQWEAAGKPDGAEWMARYFSRSVEMEWAADVYALQAGCALGIDPDVLRDAFDWIRQKYGYEGDPGHGSVADRAAHGEAVVPACPAPGGAVQAPFIGDNERH